ncbi:protein of unknown function [Nitrospira japonica]|uniref:Uncharacterized protein n=1 Tax=Nitrospira japonica TaxID=1325564 RepID=A0A1W1I5W9_9BACT|nr:protein of unknown function [Nitrospira japonica]
MHIKKQPSQKPESTLRYGEPGTGISRPPDSDIHFEKTGSRSVNLTQA